MIRYTSTTVSYAKELTSVYICYSQRNGFNIPLAIFYILYTKVSCSFGCGLSRPTSGSRNKYHVYVCTLPTSRINRPPHLAQRLINTPNQGPNFPAGDQEYLVEILAGVLEALFSQILHNKLDLVGTKCTVQKSRDVLSEVAFAPV